MSETTESCESCRFSGQRIGRMTIECRRHAPIAAHDPSTNFGVYHEAFVPRWPLMDYKHWCGDFERRTIAKDDESF